MGFTYSNLNEYKRYLCHSVPFPIAVFIAAVFRTELPLKLDEFPISVSLVAMAVLPLAGHHVGEIISKAIINMFVCIPGALLGYGLRRFSEEGTGGVIIVLVVLFILIALGIFVRSVLKVEKDGYEYAPTAFLVAMFLAFVDPLALEEIRFGQNSVYKNLQEEPFLELHQSLINSMEKEKSLSKFLCWELRWHPHPQEQYENVRDLIRHGAFSIFPLSTTVENLHLSTHLRETGKDICSESAKVLALLSDSMKNKTAPAASIDIHLTRLQILANNLKLTSYPENIHIISHLLTSVNFIEKLAISIKELAARVPFKESEHDSNLREVVTGLESPITIGNSETQRGDDNLGQVAIDFNPHTDQVGNSEIQKEKDNLGQVVININPPAGLVGNSETQREEDNLGQGANDINPPAGPVRVN